MYINSSNENKLQKIMYVFFQMEQILSVQGFTIIEGW